MKRNLAKIIAVSLFCTLSKANIVIPSNPGMRTAFLQTYIDGGRDSLPTSRKDQLLILDAVFEFHYIPAITPDSQKARNTVLKVYKYLSKKVKVSGITGTTGEIRPTPAQMRSAWATKDRKGRKWPTDRVAHHIIPLAYCEPSKGMHIAWWNISALTPQAHSDIESSRAFALLFPSATGQAS